MKGTNRESIIFVGLIIILVLFIAFAIFYFTGEMDRVREIIQNMLKVEK